MIKFIIVILVVMVLIHKRQDSIHQHFDLCDAQPVMTCVKCVCRDCAFCHTYIQTSPYLINWGLGTQF